MLTQHDVRLQLNTLANEILQSPGMYYELYSRLLSERIRRWMDSVDDYDAAVIETVAERDPDYMADVEVLVALHTPSGVIFNPAWDVSY